MICRNKFIALAGLLMALLVGNNAAAQELIKYGNFNSWITRNIKESSVLGGNTKQVYEIGPTQTINGAKAYVNMGGSPWATSNVYCKVMGITKCSNAVVPDVRNGSDKCVKMSTIFEHVKAMGMINMDVLVSGSIFLGQVMEPITSSKSPYSKMEMGVPFTRRPKYLSFDYKVHIPEGGTRVYSSGFGKKKTLAGQDYAEVYVLLQRRWEDSKGNIHAARVGTARERFGKSTSGWVNGHKMTIHYGDITKTSYYKPYMALLNGEVVYYARNSKGKMVKVIEEAWDDANATPTHVLVMASSGCGVAYTGTVGMVLWVDNMAWGF